jgi:hypothetical protein
MIGGLCWAVKAVSLMIATVQPPVVYEIAPLFFPVAVAGLAGLLTGRRSRLVPAGLAIAALAELAAVVSVLGLFFGPPDWTPSGSTVTVLTPFITVAALGSFLGLLLVGIVTRRTGALPGRWKSLPLFLAVTAIPLLASSAVLQAINERLFELPTLLIGLEWMALGTLMAKRHPIFAGAPESA